MSKVSPMVNGENNCGGGCGVVGGGEFGNSNVNMVAMMDSRSNKNQDFAATQDKCPKLYSCDFDHMYASVNDLSCTASQVKEAKHLKELLLLHLDLIQQQSEQIVTKDKQIAALKQDYETVGTLLSFLIFLHYIHCYRTWCSCIKQNTGITTFFFVLFICKMHTLSCSIAN